MNKEEYYDIPYSTNLIKNPDPIDVGLWLVNIFKNKKIDFSHRYSKEELERLRNIIIFKYKAMILCLNIINLL